MPPSCPSLSYSVLALLLFLISSAEAMADNGGKDAPAKTKQLKVSIGAIVDYSSRVGKEERTAMEMAIEDFYKYTTNKPVLHIRDSRGDPARAAFAAMDLMKEKQVIAILGFRTWEEAVIVVELGDKAQVPIVSFAESTPSWASKRWPFLIQAVHSQHNQMRAVAAIVSTWAWRRVTVIYEDIDTAASGIIPYLTNSLREVGSEIDYMLPLSPVSPSSSLSKELDKLKSRQCRVFIVHTSLPLATHLFKKAKKMGMMEKDYVWITTDSITGLLDSINPSVISSMQGVLGVKRYFPQTLPKFTDFYFRFQSRFHKEYPDEARLEPDIYGLQAYDAAWALAMAIEGRTYRKTMRNSTDQMGHGQSLLKSILLRNFQGLTGEFRFINCELAPANVFQIVNVVGKSYRELGFWLEGSGFMERINEVGTNSTSMRILGQVLWPGGPWSVPRGWDLPTSENRLRIGVPDRTTFSQFVNVRYDHPGGDPIVDGFSIDVFKAVVEQLPYHLPYKFVTHKGTYDSLVQQIHLKNFDAVVADTAIVANRCRYAEFSQPYADSGLQLVVLDRSKTPSRVWLFMKPFTTAMWVLTGGINIYNGFVIWFIERRYNPEFLGSVSNQIGTLIWLAFTTLFSLQGNRLYSNLSRMATLVWLFVALIIISSYTASLTSMLTIQRLDSTLVTVESLKSSNAMVGCDGNSFVVKYLEVVLGFNPQNIKRMSSEDEYPLALRSGKIAAAFLEVPYVKVFLAKYCKEFAVAGPTFKVGGFGFVLSRGSPLLPDISEAVLKVAESGKLRELENSLVSSYKCSSSESDADHDSLGLDSFWGLFVITGGISTIALVLFIIRYVCQMAF